MKDISLHVLDVAENSLDAKADLISIWIREDYSNNLLEIILKDNGEGMDTQIIEKATDPFFTTKKTRKVGLGLSLLKEACERCEGRFYISSSSGRGTEIKATFKLDHIDIPPIGDMAGTIATLILSNPGVDIVYIHKVDDNKFELDTREIKRELDNVVPINDINVIEYIKKHIKNGLKAIEAGRYIKIWEKYHGKTNNTRS